MDDPANPHYHPQTETPPVLEALAGAGFRISRKLVTAGWSRYEELICLHTQGLASKMQWGIDSLRHFSACQNPRGSVRSRSEYGTVSNRKAISKRTRFEILKRDGFACRYCGVKAPDAVLEIDHVKPVAGGGCNCMSNLITSCHACNRGKGVCVVNSHNEDELLDKLYSAFLLENEVRKYFDDSTIEAEFQILSSLLFGTTVEGIRNLLHTHGRGCPDGKKSFLSWLLCESFRYISQVETPK